MKAFRRILMCIFALAISISGGTALAENHKFSEFTVTSKSAEYITNAAKSDNEQRWYATVTKAAYTDIYLYFNVRKAKNGDRLSKALTFNKPAAKSTVYTTKTKKGRTVYLHAQLNSKQWTPDDFWVISKGQWCP